MIKNIIASLIMIVVLAGCKKNLLDENEYWKFEPGNAYVKFIHAYNSLFPAMPTSTNGPIVTYAINGTLVSGVNNNGVAYGGIFPNASGQYASVLPGTVSIRTALYRAPAVAAPANEVVANGNFTLNAGGYYSAFLVDTMPFPTAASPNMVLISDSAARAKPGFYKIRFAHMIPTTDTLEMISKVNQTVIAGSITYKNATPFVELPLFTRADTMQLRKKGTTAILLSQAGNFLPATERVYTFFCRGLYGSTSGSRQRVLTSYTNQ